ncbi:hypothetical protein L596_026889 [Steinernema carpocapsae]|uniref:SET domain-containing protein n=1 Tax=Steinernema carpocapsae TaxID=34508 RepID=A0A4U5M2R5_STECR|nr:hypothetical protein L596_026889 [Steinernema carpocapsae]
MANHSVSPNTHQFRLEAHNPPLYTIITSRNIQKGEEITVTYGDLDNSLLWFMFGFHIDGNPYNQAGIPWTQLVEFMLKEKFICPLVIRALSANPLNPVVYAKTNGTISDEFRQNVQLLLMSADRISGCSPASQEQLEIRATFAIDRVLRRFRASVLEKADIVNSELKFLWQDDLRSIDAALRTL